MKTWDVPRGVFWSEVPPGRGSSIASRSRSHATRGSPLAGKRTPHTLTRASLVSFLTPGSISLLLEQPEKTRRSLPSAFHRKKSLRYAHTQWWPLARGVLLTLPAVSPRIAHTVSVRYGSDPRDAHKKFLITYPQESLTWFLSSRAFLKTYEIKGFIVLSRNT